jgi:hypothetical protein
VRIQKADRPLVGVILPLFDQLQQDVRVKRMPPFSFVATAGAARSRAL